jgi:cytochrome c biogenesis protein CcdA/thiol-disulfide isomerase/thioredoxin
MKKRKLSKKILFIFFCLLILQAALFPFQIKAQEKLQVYFFYGAGCHACAQVEPYIKELQNKYPNVEIRFLEVWGNEENRQLYLKIAQSYGVEASGVPSVFVHDKNYVGTKEIKDNLENQIKDCLDKGCQCDSARLKESCICSPEDFSKEAKPCSIKLTLWPVLGAAAVDAINPCEFAVLIILMTCVLASGSRKRALGFGLCFVLAVYICYFLMGLGLFHAIKNLTWTSWIYKIAGGIAIVVGILNLKDAISWGAGGFVMEVPLGWRPKMKKFITSVTSVPAAFFAGFIVSLFLLPCTSGPYIVILGMLAEKVTQLSALGYLLLYNFIFVLPMLIITFIVYKGLKPQTLERWRVKKIKLFHLIAGIVMIGLGAVVLLNLI